MTMLEELEETVREVARTAGPSVVGVGGGRARGSGVVMSAGLVLTNAHNVWSEEIKVSFAGGRVESGRVVGADVDGDLAVLAVDTGDAPPLPWAETVPDAGTVVLALADPGGRGLRTTVGLVSSASRPFRGPRGRRITGSLEHTAPLTKGSSGGPVVDRHGRLVGINTHRLAEGFYLALPADDHLRTKVEALGRGEVPVRPRLGVGLAPDGVARRLRRSVGLDERDGVLVQVVEDDGPAARAGVRSGDLIVEAAGRPTPTADDLHDALDRSGGGSLPLRVVRGAEELEVTLELGPTTP